eukprot:155711-Rhodomonas_salina.2
MQVQPLGWEPQSRARARQSMRGAGRASGLRRLPGLRPHTPLTHELRRALGTAMTRSVERRSK